MKEENECCVSTAHPHTIKKFELIEKYVDEWARKILGCKLSRGVLFIDCMCNSGVYYDDSGNLIDGTALRVVKHLNSIIPNYPDKKAIVCLNDNDPAKIDMLKNELSKINHRNIQIFIGVNDCDQLLEWVDTKKFRYFNTLLIYDPYKAEINWAAISKYLNIWGEVIINHMVSDTTRGAKLAKKDEVIARYEQTYERSIGDICAVGNDRDKLNQIIIETLKKHITNASREHFLASVPFYNTRNGQVYNIIHCCSNIKGHILFKKIVWQIFGGKSSMKSSQNIEGQLAFGIGNHQIETVTDESCYSVDDIAKYIYNKYHEYGSVNLGQIYTDLDHHPIFPSDGFKTKIKKSLSVIYKCTFPNKEIVKFN